MLTDSQGTSDNEIYGEADNVSWRYLTGVSGVTCETKSWSAY